MDWLLMPTLDPELSEFVVLEKLFGCKISA